MVQKVTRLETNEGNEIAALIGQYIELITNQEQQQHHPITVLWKVWWRTLYQFDDKKHYLLVFLYIVCDFVFLSKETLPTKKVMKNIIMEIIVVVAQTISSSWIMCAMSNEII